MMNEEMLSYTQITNVSFVGYKRSRLWAHLILIDDPIDTNGKSPFDCIRQIRGFTNGGLNVFTFWIRPDAEVKFETYNNGLFVVLSKKEPITIGNGIRIVVDDLILDVAVANHERPVDIRHIQVESTPHGFDVDREILKYYKSPAYCVTGYMPTNSAKEVTGFLKQQKSPKKPVKIVVPQKHQN